MKNVFFSAVAALLFSASVQAQSTVDSIAAKYKLVPMPEALTMEKTFPVLGSYQLSAPVAAPGAVVTTDASATTTDASGMSTTSNVTITLDSANKGIIWIEGLPQGKFKAFLKQSPATYRVIAQKTETGTNVPEGTLYFDPSTKTLNVALGKVYDEMDPMAVFALNTPGAENAAVDNSGMGNTVKVKTKTASSKTKTKLSFYTASKIEPVAAPTSTDSTQQQAPDSTQHQNQQQ